MLAEFNRWIAEYGAVVYLIIFAWSFLEGETFLIFAGVVAAQGTLELPLVVLAACLGSFAGDQTYFLLGRRFGPYLVRRFPKWSAGIGKALAWLERYDTWFILSFRFIYGIRNVSSFAMGLSPLRWKRFMALNLISAFLWAGSFAGAGYLFGQAMSAVVADVARNVAFVLLGVFLVLAWAALSMHRRQRQRANEAQTQAPSAAQSGVRSRTGRPKSLSRSEPELEDEAS